MNSLIEYDDVSNLDEYYDEFSPEEMREALVNQIRFIVNYWAFIPNKTEKERCEGVAASIFGIIDGLTYLPSFEIKTKVDKRNNIFRHEDGLKIYPDNCVINENGLELVPLIFDEDWNLKK